MHAIKVHTGIMYEKLQKGTDNIRQTHCRIGGAGPRNLRKQLLCVFNTIGTHLRWRNHTRMLGLAMM
jgi:hypothetical protein